MSAYPIIPEIVFSTTIVIYFCLGLFIKNRNYLTVLGVCSSLLTTVMIFSSPMGSLFGGMFVSDALSQSFKLVFHISLILSLLISLRYEAIRDEYFFDYTLLMMLSTLAMMLIASSRDLIALFLSIEFMALCMYTLTGFSRCDLRSNEAGLKYYILGTLASVTLLFGITAIYGITGTTDIKAIGAIFYNNSGEPNPYQYVGVLAILIALAFKAGAAPFHQWSPDAYEGAPTTVTAFMSVGPKAAVLGAMGTVFYVAFKADPEVWVNALIFIAIATMAIGNIMALRQENIKRLLAYSSIAHAGYMMLGILAGSLEGLQSVLIYMMIYAFMNLGAFAIVLSIKDGEHLRGYTGLWHTNPYTAIGMLILLFSLAGIPPFAGFIAKFKVFMAAVHAGYTWVAVVGVLFSVLSAYYYLKIVVRMFFVTEQLGIRPVAVSANLSIAIILTVFFVCLIGIAPSVLL